MSMLGIDRSAIVRRRASMSSVGSPVPLSARSGTFSPGGARSPLASAVRSSFAGPSPYRSRGVSMTNMLRSATEEQVRVCVCRLGCAGR
jgi:hypothetical protein